MVVRYKIGNPRGEISLHVFLRLTAMDVLLRPAPPGFLIANPDVWSKKEGLCACPSQNL